MPFDLLSFLKSAKLGAISLGMTRAHLEDLLGKPQLESGISPEFGNTFIQYGSWQFHFLPKATSDGVLSKIFVDDISTPLAHLGLHSRIWCWELAWGSRFALVKASLERERIQFIAIDERFLQMTSGVKLGFDRNDGDTATVLTSISLNSF